MGDRVRVLARVVMEVAAWAGVGAAKIFVEFWRLTGAAVCVILRAVIYYKETLMSSVLCPLSAVAC